MEKQWTGKTKPRQWHTTCVSLISTWFWTAKEKWPTQEMLGVYEKLFANEIFKPFSPLLLRLAVTFFAAHCFSWFSFDTHFFVGALFTEQWQCLVHWANIWPNHFLWPISNWVTFETLFSLFIIYIHIFVVAYLHSNALKVFIATEKQKCFFVAY